MSEPMADGTIVQPQMKKSDEVSYENYFFSLLTFRVEGQPFRVPRAPFDESPAFLLKFNVPPPSFDGSDWIGVPVIDIKGVKKNDFLALLKVLIPHGLSSKKVAKPIDLSDKEWMSVVALASEWDFPETLELAKDNLKDKATDLVVKIGLAQQFNVPEWLYSSYAILTMRDTSLSEDEAKVLGFRLSMKLSKAREELLELLKAKMSDSQSVDGNNLGKTVLKILVNLFGETVRTYLKDDDKVFGGTDEGGLDDSRAMGRSWGTFIASGTYTVSLARDQVVEVIEFGPSTTPWDWIIKTSDSQIGITKGAYLFPLTKKYQYSSKAKMNRDTLADWNISGLLIVKEGQIVEVDMSFHPKWNCLPAKLNDVEGFAFGDDCTFI